MHEFYEKSLQKIRQLKNIPSESEWNKIAMEEGLLSSESLKFISKKRFKELCLEIRKNDEDIKK